MSATRFASEQGGYQGLNVEVQQCGGSATFEYVGKQNPMKVQHTSTRLGLVVVRDRETGERHLELRGARGVVWATRGFHCSSSSIR